MDLPLPVELLWHIQQRWSKSLLDINITGESEVVAHAGNVPFIHCFAVMFTWSSSISFRSYSILLHCWSSINKLFSKRMYKDTVMEVSCSYEFYEQFDGNHIKWKHKPTNQLCNALTPIWCWGWFTVNLLFMATISFSVIYQHTSHLRCRKLWHYVLAVLTTSIFTMLLMLAK